MADVLDKLQNLPRGAPLVCAYPLSAGPGLEEEGERGAPLGVPAAGVLLPFRHLPFLLLFWAVVVVSQSRSPRWPG